MARFLRFDQEMNIRAFIPHKSQRFAGIASGSQILKAAQNSLQKFHPFQNFFWFSTS